MTLPRLFDTHCHLNLGALAEAPDTHWEEARRAGVDRAVLVGIDLATSEALVEFVAGRSDLRCTVGIHPNDVSSTGSGDMDGIRRLADRDGVVGIGETGVDRYWKRSSEDDQRRFLIWHTELALERDLALVLHIRDGFELAAEVLAPYASARPRGILHCFTGGPEALEPFLDWGFYVSFSGVLTYPKAPLVREAARLVPADRVVIETDAPFLAPQPVRGRTNTPAYLVHTAQCLADVRGWSFVETARVTTENACRAFGLAE